MKLLLDTHIWIWSRGQVDRITPVVSAALDSPENELWLSPLSIWELSNLVEKRRVILDRGFEDWLGAAMAKLPLREAPITHEVALETRRVQLPHRDPVDRFLIATARVFGLTLVTADKRLLTIRDVSILANR
ncbi:MAG: type II toxin-antitoxin system VapC family toxin [Acidobacteria bacterium]|nr:type II toxin-antitoxin system VapC family toxin [Acidobacteriota bacterium]